MLQVSKHIGPFRLTEPPDIANFAGYCRVIEDKFCPFLRGSHSRVTSRYTVLDLTGLEPRDCAVASFEASIPLIEVLRSLSSNPETVLSENLVIRSGDLTRQWMKRIGWMLKWIYTGERVMVGKFFAGDTEISRGGEAMPAIPLSYFSFRPATLARDLRFFGNSPKLRPAFLEAQPSSDAQWAAILGDHLPLYCKGRAAFLAECNTDTLGHFLATLAEADTFDRARQCIYELGD